MEEVADAIAKLETEQLKDFVLGIYWFFATLTIFFTLQVGNWYPFKKAWKNRKTNHYGWFALLLIIPFHIIAFLGGLWTCSMFVNGLVFIIEGLWSWIF